MLVVLLGLLVQWGRPGSWAGVEVGCQVSDSTRKSPKSRLEPLSCAFQLKFRGPMLLVASVFLVMSPRRAEDCGALLEAIQVG